MRNSSCRRLWGHRMPAAALSLAALLTVACSDEDGTVGPVASGTAGPSATVADPTASGSMTQGIDTTPVPVGSLPANGPMPSTTVPPDTSIGEPEPAAPVATAPTDDFVCSGTEIVAPKRIVRLTFNQLANSLRYLLGDELADSVSTTFEIGDPTERAFPPLSSPREGSLIIDSQWQAGDAVAKASADYVLANFSTVTGCAEPATLECAQAFVSEFGERAFRRPLDAGESERLLGVFSNAQVEGATIEEAVQFSVYAALSAPQFLYRTEFGTDSAVEGALSPYEVASQISYFVTDGPPDDALLEAAAAGMLSTAAEIGAHVDRLLLTEEARVNLQSAMFAYFGIPTLATIIVDPAVAPEFTEGLRASMMREVELFLNHTLWNGSVPDLLLSKQSFANESVANVYGVTVGMPLDADGFGPITLPDNRSGLLTAPGFMTARSSPDRPSVVRRGLLVNSAIMCASNPPFPEDPELVADIEESIAATEELSEREKANVRATQTPCNTCHLVFDAYGLSLDTFDVIGKYREVDPQGRPIDPTVTLPPQAGGAMVMTPAEMAEQIVDSGAFATCMSKNLLAYALAEGAQLNAVSCSTKAVADAFATTDLSFGSLIRQVAVSQTFSVRSAGGGVE